jgi:hypothetical protein
MVEVVLASQDTSPRIVALLLGTEVVDSLTARIKNVVPIDYTNYAETITVLV